MTEKYTSEQLRALIAEQKKEVDFYERIINVTKNNGWRKGWGWFVVLMIVGSAFMGGISASDEATVIAIVGIGSLVYYLSILKDENETQQKLLSAKTKLQEYEEQMNNL